MILAAEFAEFLETISLGDAQRERIQSAVDGLVRHLGEELALAADKFFLQGSFVNGTAVKPPPSNENGEYDVDLVVVMAEPDESAEDALDRLHDAIAQHGRYKDRLSQRKPCVRVEYAEDDVGKFHVDVIPLKNDPDEGLMAPRRGEGWHKTRPREYTEWCRAQGESFSRTVRMLKRWRDEHQTARTSVKSIVLQVLISEHLGESTDDGPRISETLSSLEEALRGLAGPPEVRNPVLEEEDLAARWPADSFRSFQREVTEAADLARRGVSSEEDGESSRLWRALLGDDFPELEAEDDVSVADTSHAWGLDKMGWAEALDQDYRISLRTVVYRQRRPYMEFNGRGVLPSNRELQYIAEVRGPLPAQVWWQVINTGAHAASAGGLRGQIFEARARSGGNGTSPDDKVNWEHTSYTGGHLIEAFLVRDNIVVARSGRMRVPIENPSRPPRGRRRRRH